ncbi:MAG: efflux RND transporter permease subunit [Planctomycetaceae bacterium]|nr:efflux RND transporter permease subunit [Planctomycetaceae bacterium]
MNTPMLAPRTGGPIEWMILNRVTPNLLMMVLLFGGLFMTTRITQEVFPEYQLDLVTVSVPYPGSSPEEVEQGIILVIEEAIRGLEGIKEITAQASEGNGRVTAELLEGANRQQVYQDIKQEVDRITTFPLDAEEPEVSLVMRRREVLDIQIYGNVSEWVLTAAAEQVRDSLLLDPRITQVELEGARDYEVQVLIDQDTLRTYHLTLQEIANKIKAAAVELPGGYVETSGGDVMLRVTERRDWAREFAAIPIISTESGSTLYLSDIAHVKDDFQDVARYATFNGQRAIGVDVYRVGDQTPISVSDAARQAMQRIESQLPPGVDWSVRRDMADTYRQRLKLLLKNAFYGLLLVLAILGLFLEFKLAFWVTMAIPSAFLGTFLFLPAMGVTINMMSMFAFIVALGMVVDNAIIVGENVYDHRKNNLSFLEASIKGTREMAIPVAFSILTNIASFIPLLYMPGSIGKAWKVVPLVVIAVFFLSWVEALLVLPSHLAYARRSKVHWIAEKLHAWQQVFSRYFEYFVREVFGSLLRVCIRFRLVTTAVCILIMTVVFSYVASGRVGWILAPRIEADYASVTVRLPFGSPIQNVQQVSDLLVQKARQVVEENGGDKLCTGIFAEIEEDTIDIRVYLTDPDLRPISTTRVTELWRRRVGQIPGLESIRFEADRGGLGSGAALTVELSHRDIKVLDKAGERLAALLSDFPKVKDIDDGYTPGKDQLNLQIKPEGLNLGLTASELARQVRNSFYGAEALRQQRGRSEIRVRVKFPKEQRVSEYDIEQLLIRTPAGTDVPLVQVADITRGKSYTVIDRRNGRRTVSVTANVEPIDESSQVMETLNRDILPQLMNDYPGLSYVWEGNQADMSESFTNLFKGLILSLFGIYVLLAIPFRSYIQPMIVMVAIPFGVVGAVLGHMMLGYSLSIMSMMGIVALAGVVVNGSLVLIDYANILRRQDPDLPPVEAIRLAGIRRFRPIMLTTLTTFGGLAPMIYETSRQARFMIPMALSLGYGILFSTGVTLVLVPCLYMMLEDIKQVRQKKEEVARAA